jgi:ubiquinone/menaquinone biosynthesis C-methylase UbiE
MEFENYTDTSKTYDSMRVPVDLDGLQRCLEKAAANQSKAVSEIKLLDVGCGTGNYTRVLADRVGSIQGLEFNEGMFEQCMQKVKDCANVTLTRGSCLDMQMFEPGEFDVVIMTQVIHHLTLDSHQLLCAQVSRVLKPGGLFWMNTCTPA